MLFFISIAYTVIDVYLKKYKIKGFYETNYMQIAICKTIFAFIIINYRL